MDIYERLQGMLEPLGGELNVDAFVRALRRLEKDKEEAGGRIEEPEPAAAAPPVPEPRKTEPVVKEGRLDDEIEWFMKRDEVQTPEDDEIRQFIQERGGFDPSEVE